MKNAKNNNNKKEILTFEKLFKMTDEQLLTVDLDNLNAQETASFIDVMNGKKLSNSSTRKNTEIFKYDDGMTKAQQKSLRTKARKKINTFADRIVEASVNKNKTVLKEEINSFISYYKKTYLLNDFSLESLRRRNSDKVTKLKLTAMLKIVKDFKSGNKK